MERRAALGWHKNILAGLEATLICTFFSAHYCTYSYLSVYTFKYLNISSVHLFIYCVKGHSKGSNLDIVLGISLSLSLLASVWL